MAPRHPGPHTYRGLINLIGVLGFLLISPAWAATPAPSTVTFDKAVVPVRGIVTPIPQSCTMIYPRDVQERTYHIVSPGRYCLASDLNATPSAPTNSTTLDILAPPYRSNPIYSGAAIHIHASDVEIDFGGHALNDSGKSLALYGVRIESGQNNIHVHDGFINGFDSGLSGVGGGSLKLSGIRIQRMQFYGNDTGLVLVGIRDSNISQSRFAADTMGFGLSDADSTVVTNNRFELPATGSGWAVGLYTSWGARGLTITENVFSGRNHLTGLGIHLHNHTWKANNEELSRNNRIERNTFYALEEPIVVTGSGIGRGNVIRQNQIYGDAYMSILRTYPAGFPRQFTAIRVENNEDAEISGNYVFTSPSLPYFYGISVDLPNSIKRDANGFPLLRFNETCGVADPLLPPSGVPESSIDGGNYWNTFCRIPGIF